MEPIRTARSNIVYIGPSPDVGDAWTESEPGTAWLVWEPTEEERAAIAGGANLRLGVHQHPMPPVSLGISHERRLSPEGAEWCDRARAILRPISSGPWTVPAGYWAVSPDVLGRLIDSGALDMTDVPVLLGRPLMSAEDLPADSLAFEVISEAPADPVRVRRFA